MSARIPAVVHAAVTLSLVLCLGAASAAADGPRSRWGGDESRIFTVDDVVQILISGDGPVIVDSRSPKEFAEGHVPGAINLPHKEVWGRIAELEAHRDRGLVFYCERGTRADISADAMITEGFPKIGVMWGHYEEWTRRGLPVERER